VDFWTKVNKYQHDQNYHKGKVGAEERRNKKKKIKCDLCEDGSDGFRTKLDLISHKIRVHGMDPFRCDICGATFNVKGRLNRHVKEHNGMEFKKEWRCEVEGCGKVFTTHRGLRNHGKWGHGGEEMPFVCDVCGKGFSQPGSLKTHRDSVHLKIKPWICEECGEGFTNGNTLKRHKLVHTGERPFACEICGQRFRQKEVLKTHVKGHQEKGEGFKPNGSMKQLRKRKAN